MTSEAASDEYQVRNVIDDVLIAIGKSVTDAEETIYDYIEFKDAGVIKNVAISTKLQARFEQCLESKERIKLWALQSLVDTVMVYKAQHVYVYGLELENGVTYAAKAPEKPWGTFPMFLLWLGAGFVLICAWGVTFVACFLIVGIALIPEMLKMTSRYFRLLSGWPRLVAISTRLAADHSRLNNARIL